MSSLPRLIGLVGYLKASDIQLFMPRSRSIITKTGVWNCSARSNASIAIVSTLRPRTEEHDVLGVAVREERRLEQVALRGARRQAGGGSDPLDVEDHGRRFGVIRQARELAHQRDAGAGRGRHRARRPSSPRSPCRATRFRPPPARSRRWPCPSPCRRGISSCSRSAIRRATTTA